MTLITHVAIKTYNKIFSLPKPNRHHNVLRMMMHERDRDYGTEIQGFLDDQGNFLNRKDAYIIACNSGQMDRSNHPPKHYDGDELFSEDLW